MKTYKGFNKNMICRGFLYEEGKEYEERNAIACKAGFHACEYPLDCFSYYSPDEAVYHEVEQTGKISKHDVDTKIASTKIKIGAEIGIPGLVKAAIEYTKERVNPEADSNKDRGASTATGDRGASIATGDYGSAEAKNATAIAVAWGYNGKARGELGSFLVLAEWEDNYLTKTEWSFKGAKMVRVDGDTIKENTWYTNIGGKIVEVN